MNASGLTCFRKGAIDNTQNPASRVSVVIFATLCSGLRAMRSPLEVRPFAAFKRGALLRLGLFGRNCSETSLANLFPRFWRADVFTVLSQLVGMFGQMLVTGKAFKILNSVVGLVAVDVVNMFAWIKRFEPACSHNSVHKPKSAEREVSVITHDGFVGLEFSENFSAARNCVEMVEESKRDSVYFNAYHVVPHGG